MDIQQAALVTKQLMEKGRQIGKWPASGPLSFTHIYNLLTSIETGLVSGEKAHRWLGWSQCAIVAAGAGTLEDMKRINNN